MSKPTIFERKPCLCRRKHWEMGVLESAPEWLYLNDIGMATQQGVRQCLLYQKADLFFIGRSDVQVRRVFMLDAE